MKICIWSNEWMDRVIFTGEHAILQELQSNYAIGWFGPYVWYKEICRIEVNEVRDNDHASEIVRTLMDMAGL